MKAAVLYANDDIRWADWPAPEARPGHVVVKVKSAGICGSDVPRVLQNGAHYYPIVLGHEFSGEIAEVGEGVEGFAVGDTVTGAPLLPCMVCADCQKGNFSLCKHYGFIGSRDQGAFAEYVAFPAANAVRFDPAVSFDQAAFFEPSTIALHGVRLNGYIGGADVAVLGGGGTIGLFTLQWARIFGAKSVTAFDISDERLARAAKLGADAAVNTLTGDIEKDKYNFVFDASGQPDTIRLSFELAANRARVCLIGTPTKDITFTPRLWEDMNRKEFLLTGSWMSYSAPFPGEEWELTARYFSDGRLKYDPAMVFKRFPMERAQEAFGLFKEPGKVKGKVLLYNP
ncbi:MAG: galactitol-1-phosphate 5-dehydrogenase [Firmicutes bacterium]|nr:galactitol-1-phosphate 5-dehydrogenase [Bacillota bacterium]